MAYEHFKTLLEGLQNSDNNIRYEAERQYREIPIPLKFEYVLNIMMHKEEERTHRLFSGILCRRLLKDYYLEAFENRTAEGQTCIKNILINLIFNETDQIVRKRLVEIIIEIAGHHFNEDGSFEWTDLLNLIFNQCLNSTNEELQLTGLRLFKNLPNMLPSNQQENVNLVGRTLGKYLRSANENGTLQSISVREAATKTFCSFIIGEFKRSQNVAQLRDLIPIVLQVILDSIQENPFKHDVIDDFIDLVDQAPQFLKTNIPQVLQLCLLILQNQEMKESHYWGIEIFVSLSEVCTKAVRKCKKESHEVIQYLFKMLTEIEDDPNWSNMDKDESDNETAEISLFRIALAIPGKSVLDEIKQTVPTMLSSEDWKHRQGGLKALSNMFEGLKKDMVVMLGNIITDVARLLTDQHPRVRYAALACVKNMSIEFGPELQTNYHAILMPTLVGLLDDHENPKVQAKACDALVYFCKDAPKDVICIYLHILAEKLYIILINKCNTLATDRKTLVLKSIVQIISALSNLMKKKFGAYYEWFMPIMKSLFQYSKDQEDLQLLRCKTIKCISFLGVSVCKETFLADTKHVTSVLVQLQMKHDNKKSLDALQHSYITAALESICKIIGHDFAPYFPYLIGPTMNTASMSYNTCLKYDEESKDMGSEDGQGVTPDTSKLEDKLNACQMLICFAKELKTEFAPYVIDVTKIMLPLLKFNLSYKIQSTAARIIPYLLECAALLGDSVRDELWGEMIDNLLMALKSEKVSHRKVVIFEAIAEGIKRIGPTSMTLAHFQSLLESIQKSFEDIFHNQEDHMIKCKSDDHSHEEIEYLNSYNNEDNNILIMLAKINQAIFKIYQKDAMVFFRQIENYVNRLIENPDHWSNLKYGICFLDDVIEFTGVDSYPYICNILPIFQSAILHPKPEVRQAAAYGFGIMAMYGGEDYIPFLSGVSIIMGQYMMSDATNAPSQDIDMICYKENVISALTKICKYRPTCIPGGDLNQFLSTWLTWLPIYEDDEETPHVYGYLCDLLEDNNPVIIGVNNSNLAWVVKAIAMCITKEGLPVETDAYRRCLSIIRTIQQDGAFFLQVVQNLTDEEKICLGEALSKVPNQ